MTSINAALKLSVRSSGRGELQRIASDLDKLEKKARKARDSAGKYISGTFQGPMLPGGGFTSGGGPGGPGGGGRGPGGSRMPGGSSGRGKGGGTLAFAANAELAASNFERIASAGKTLLKKPIEDFFSLESSMARVASKMDVLSTVDYARLKNAAIAAGAATGYSSKEAADGLGEMAAAGYSVEQQISALPAVLQLAKAGELDVGRATAIAASTMSQFALRAADTGHIGDVLVSAANASVISVDDLAETLKYVGPIAHAAGISLEETAASAAVLGNAGIEASMAGTGLRAVIAAFAKQTPKATKAMRGVGIGAKEMAEGVSSPLTLLGTLGKKLEHATDAKKLKTLADVFGAPAAPAAATLMEAVSKIGEDGLTAIERARKATNNANGQLERAAKILGGTGEAKLKRFSAQVSATSAEIGEVLAPTLLEGTAKAQEWVKEFGAFAKENPGLIAGLGRITFGLTAISTGAAVALRVAGATAPLWSGMAKGAAMAAGGIKSTVDGMQGFAKLMGASQGAATAITGLFAVPAAAAAGWWFGQEIDSAIGKLFNLRGELASTELALRAGEATSNDNGPAVNTMAGAASTKNGEFQTSQQQKNWENLLNMIPGREGNAERSALDEQFASEARQRNGRMTTTSATRADAGFNAVSGKLEVFVTDDRVRTKLSGNTGRLGHQEIR